MPIDMMVFFHKMSVRPGSMGFLVMVMVMVVIAAAITMVVMMVPMVMVVIMAVSVIVVMTVLMVMSAAAVSMIVAVLVLMLMVMAVDVVMVMTVLMVMSAAAVLMLMIMAVLVTMVMSAAAVLMLMIVTVVMRMIVAVIVTVGCSGIAPAFPAASFHNHHIRFHGSDRFLNLRKNSLRVLCTEPELLCGVGYRDVGQLRHLTQFILNLGCTVGTVKALQNIDLSLHLLISFLHFQDFFAGPGAGCFLITHPHGSCG